MSAVAAGVPKGLIPGTAEVRINAIADVYIVCLKCLIALSQDDHGIFGEGKCRSFKKDLGRLYLWGEDLQGPKLEKIVKRSKFLTNTILKFMVCLGDALSKNM